MSDRGIPYHLVHILTGNEHKTPLVASQLFDRAQVQATAEGADKPLSVSVWIIASMREVFEKENSEIIKALQKRCPNIKIKIIGGIGRLGYWPIKGILRRQRKMLGARTVYHCRGTSAFPWAYMLKDMFSSDAWVLDIRGYGPLERFINDDKVRDENDMDPAQKEHYLGEVAHLRKTIQSADVVCTVSEPLRSYLIKHDGAGENTLVLPCSVKDTIPDTNREKVRQELNIQDKTAILYLGGTQKGQYLEELAIPFVRSAVSQSEQYVGVFITQNKAVMLALLAKFNIAEDRIRVISVSQEEVGNYLTGMDMGLLLRAPSIQNNFSQPVKFGEYLGGGVPIVLEEGTGDLAEKLNKYNIGCVVSLSDKSNPADFDSEVSKALTWYEANKEGVRARAKSYVTECYTWKANVHKERNMYLEALKKK